MKRPDGSNIAVAIIEGVWLSISAEDGSRMRRAMSKHAEYHGDTVTLHVLDQKYWAQLCENGTEPAPSAGEAQVDRAFAMMQRLCDHINKTSAVAEFTRHHAEQAYLNVEIQLDRKS